MKCTNLVSLSGHKHLCRGLNVRIAASALLLVLTCVGVSSAQTVKTIHSFAVTDGEYPQYTVLTQGRDGQVYGTAFVGGTGNFGTIFKQRSSGNGFFVLHNFTGSDGYAPQAGLLLARDGNFYGTTNSGGASNTGVLFMATPGGVVTVLHSFVGGTDGAYPAAAPIEASDGSLYGTTCGAGIYNPTIYKSTSSGSFSTIYTLTSSEGASVNSALLQANDGSLYALSGNGGVNHCGAILQISTSGIRKNFQSFDCGAGGGFPNAALIQATDGTLYGTTSTGGSFSSGTIFKLGTNGAITTLYSFGATSTDGLYPGDSLAQGSDGNFYGSTPYGGTAGGGTLFKYTSSGVYTQLYSFPIVNSVMQLPLAALLQHTNGQFFGLTNQGGVNGLGSIYSLNVGLGPFVTFVHAQGKAGSKAQILGQGLTGTTSITFNGVNATNFKVVSDTYITAEVPSGATTGPLAVTTPTGTLTSNVNFRVQ